MVRGAFKSFAHLHEFVASRTGTTMIDTLEYKPPLGVLGALANLLVLERHMRRFLHERASHLKDAAEEPVSSAP